jgi:hypothetical protein
MTIFIIGPITLTEQRECWNLPKVMIFILIKRMRFSRLLAIPVLLLGFRGTIRRAFGDMAYGRGMSEYPENYRIVGFQEAIRRTEGDSKWQA